jgi:hypothetical protein
MRGRDARMDNAGEMIHQALSRLSLKLCFIIFGNRFRMICGNSVFDCDPPLVAKTFHMLNATCPQSFAAIVSTHYIVALNLAYHGA